MSIKSFLFNRLLPLYRLREIISYLYTWDLRKQEGVLEAVVRSSFINLLARGLGYLKNILIAVLLGFSVKTDGYFMALSLLGLFLIFAGVFDSIGIPSLVKAKQENMEEFKKLCGFLLVFTLTLAILFSALALLLMPLILKIPIGFKEETLRYLKISYLLLIPYVFLSFIFQHFGAVLRSLRRFTVYFLSEFIISIFSFLIIVFGLLIYKDYWVLPLSLTLSQALATSFIVFEGREFIYFSFHKDERVRAFLRRFFQLSALYGLSHLYIILDRAFASLLPERSVSAMSYGVTILTGLGSLLRIESVAITSLSEERGSLEKLKFYINKLSLVTIPISIFLFIFSEFIVKLLFGYGAFSKVDISLTSNALRFYSISFPLMFIWPLIYRVFQIREEMGKLAKIAITGVFLNGALNYLFMIKLGLGMFGICLGTFFSYVYSCVVGYSMLKRK